ncbi:LPS assembly protein LptD [Thermomonas sp. HDW16]|uniref:LPS assembly protein LptD n=1 Tax=Thermomonas sp. HDW16 TaxID=2714945 RepID=UPI001409B19E|nr:LPS assembly protein LptD [Thermomonas sp. HDW16]QIL21333.1 LPS assembly protein LptD [Thermomonas sp. HDW16]
MRPALRLLPLPLCIAFSLQARAADDMPLNWGLCPVQDVVKPFAEAQAVPEGLKIDNTQEATDIEGDALSGTEDNPVFNGNVTLRRGNQFMGADELTYDKQQEHYTAEGSIRYQGAGLRMTAARAEGDQAKDVHTIHDLDYQLLSQRGNGGADSVTLSGNIGSLRGATYSTCPPESRHWELRARRIDVDTEDGMAVAHGATLRVGKVPVIYLPWFMFPTDERRRTGLLFPSISNSSRNGFDWRQPIYLNLAPNYDVTLSPRLMTERGVQLGAQFRYLVEGGTGTVEGTYMPNDKLRDRDRSLFHYGAFQNLGANWQARANLNWISDTRYYEDFNNSLDGLSQFTAHSEVGVYGRGYGWDAGFSADHWQLADFTLTENILPYNRMPRAYVHWERSLGLRFVGGVDAEAVRFQHSVYDAGSRLDVKPWISLPLEGDSWFLRPIAAFRHTSYQLDGGLADSIARSRAVVAEEALGRFWTTDTVPTSVWQPLLQRKPISSTPVLSLDAGVYFDRDTRVKGKDYLQTIEPRLYYLRVPYTNQDDMPLFDTQPLTFGWGQLFRDNRYSGADRQADANQLTLAVSTRMIRQSDGRERFSASLGQIRYFDESRVRIPGEPITEKGRSAWVADANYAPTDRWTFGASYQWDPKANKTDLASVRARYLLPDDGVFNLGYRYRRQVLEQADISFLYPISPSWSVVGRYYYSMFDNKALETLAGFQWDSCCVAVRLVGRRYVHNRAGDLSNAIMFEIELKGLGSAGQDTRRALRRAILGYNRDDLYLVPPQTATGQPTPPDIDTVTDTSP